MSKREKNKKRTTTRIDKSALRSPKQSIASLRKLAEYISKSQGNVLSSQVLNGELTLEIAPENILDFLKFLRNDYQTQFTVLIDLCGVDHPERVERFDVVYHLLSMTKNERIRIKTKIAEDQPVHSIVSVYPAASWFEREAFDLYGILFSAHPDLRRLLTDYGFEGHPLRKDFPLTGFVETRYDEERQAVIYEPVKLVQEFRNFDFLSPWERMDDPEDSVFPPGSKGENAILTDEQPIVSEEKEPQFADPDKNRDSKIS